MLRAKTKPFDALQGHKYISLTTFRKNGQPVPTPVWFAEVEDRLFVMTPHDAGKVKRIHHNAQVEVAPCDFAGNLLGEPAEAMAMILPDQDFKQADCALSQKYGITKRLYMLMWRMRGIRPTYLEITPM